MCDSTKENAPPMTATTAAIEARLQKNTREMEALLAGVQAAVQQHHEVLAIEAPPTPPALLAIEPAPADLTPIEPTPEELRVALAASGLPSSSIGHPLVMKIVEAKRAAAMAAAHSQTEPVHAELAPPPPPASTWEPHSAQALMMQLCILFSNNKACIAYHEIVAGKTFGALVNRKLHCAFRAWRDVCAAVAQEEWRAPSRH